MLANASIILCVAAVVALDTFRVDAGEPPIELSEREFFEREIRPLLVEHCDACHNQQEQRGGLRLDVRQGWATGGDSGPAIVPGDPESSLLIRAVRYGDPHLQMPPDGRLSPDTVATLERWVTRGAPDPRSSEVSEPIGETDASAITRSKSFWSFQPLSSPPVPTNRDSSWPTTPVDQFILKQLQDRGLAPARAADKRTLIRRVTFDLTGLPPTSSEVEAFVADRSERAYDKVVHRLLCSPSYGERWGRHWLDVARYADSNGLDENLAYGNAWRYRDYVISSFNEDKPFDQFLIEQIAGDLLPRADRETRTATGFLALGAKVLAEPDREKLVMDTIDEQIDTTGKAFLGMTLGCARCHDHKFDPIRQQDYYALAAIFKSTKTFGDTNQGAIRHWFEHSFATDQERQKIKEVDDRIAQAQRAATAFKNQSMSDVRQQAVERAAQYLGAAARFEPSTSLSQVATIAKRDGLHPRILHHCRLHLQYREKDPIVAKWRALAATMSPEQLESYFTNLFRIARQEPDDRQRAEQETEPAAPKEKARTDPNDSPPDFDSQLIAQAHAALKDPSGLISVPPQPEHAFAPETLAEYNRLMEKARLIESGAPDETAAMGVSDASVFEELPVHIRGSHHNLGAPVRRAFPQVMRTSAVPPVLPRGQSGRLQLARWMADSRHPLTARVYVNRIWGWHFGNAIVRTTENFGKLGDRPSHPELLDWLTRFFIESGWSTKELHRVIVLSSTYRMQSRSDLEEAAESFDPENRLLWKFPRRRLDAEQLRDALLMVSGRLDRTPGGKSVPLRNRQFVFNHTSVDHTKYDSLRRAVYLPVIRNNLYPFFRQFDFPDPTMPTGRRAETVVAPQSLLMMNDPLVLDAAQGLAEHILRAAPTDEARIAAVYRRTLSREPEADEIEQANQFLDDVVSLEPTARWTLFCQALLISNEFLYLR
ncbi:DUF1553 domain-containing protein [Roseiconus nitratireducens]|uniref:DUF1553 domain-containing protein n=1 Tax=Roseiconus nitratireducens TaxID=2605748 RepID=A0A5M6DF46_9BACT|nr:PSD1 and planctomycete cytochrome C domain-containing protein [Roseiconus nitratireducens]KAA5546167.1 DUF1553 domain-containing protein [Roseiconus nitratireducens]